MVGNGNLGEGIRLILGEIRDLRKDLADDKKQAAEDRRRMLRLMEEAAEDRRQAAEDRKQAAEDRKQAAEDRSRGEDNIRGIRQALVVIGGVGRRIHATLDEHSRLLREILSTLKRQGNGHPRGNGSSRRS
jgi:predicted  nucleic acid-binding Zn-ribbon protein